MVVRTLCSNRDLPLKLPRVGEEVRFEPAFSAPGIKAKGIRNPTGTLRPANPRGRYWHLVSHLNLNHMSLTDDTGDTGSTTVTVNVGPANVDQPQVRPTVERE